MKPFPAPRLRARGCIAVLALLCAVLLPCAAQDRAASAALRATALPGLQAVVGELRRGGLVIFFRHGATDPMGRPDTEADMARCDTQRVLSAAGRAQFVAIGQAFLALGIGVDSVASSPFCRCRDSAQLAFGRYVASADLSFALEADAARTRELNAALRRRLGTPPAPGLNTVIVSHMANLREATGLWAGEEGMAFVFRPLSGGRFEAIARIAAADWTPPAPARRIPRAG